jgi:hypothetical protein
VFVFVVLLDTISSVHSSHRLRVTQSVRPKRLDMRLRLC